MVRGGWHSLQASKRAALLLKLNAAWLLEGQGPRQGTQHELMLSGKAPDAGLLPAESWEGGPGAWAARLSAMGAPAHMQIPNVGMRCDDFMKYKSQMNFL